MRISPLSLFAAVAFAVQRTVGTAAAAGGFSCGFVLFEMQYNKDNYCKEYSGNYYCADIVH